MIMSLVMMAITVACGAGASATASPGARGSTPAPTPATPSSEPTPTPGPAAAVLAACADAPQPTAEPIVIELVAVNSEFEITHLEGPRHCEPFAITLTNRDRVWEHNVTIALMDEDDARIFVGPLVTAPATKRYDIPALPAGEYRFYCLPHREFMRGTIVVAP